MRNEPPYYRQDDSGRTALIVLRSLESAFRNAADRIEASMYHPPHGYDFTNDRDDEEAVSSKRGKVPAVMGVQEVCKLLHISKPKLYELVKAGKIPCIRVGRALRFSDQGISEYIREEESASKQQ